MHITRLALDHFRSWEQCVVDFAPGVNILQGANGLGKTNIVEAVEFIATGGSHRASGSLPLIERGATSATIRVNVVDDGPDAAPDAAAAGGAGTDGTASGGTASAAQSDAVVTYEATIAARGANRARINGGPSRYMRDIAGAIPCVAFTPEDQRLVAGDPASRRTFLNQAGVQLIPGYADRMQAVSHIAKQRSTLLKQLGSRDRADAGAADAALSGLEIWTGQFIGAGVALTRMRADIVARLAGPFSAIYGELAGDGQLAGLEYDPSFEEVLLYERPEPEISRHFQRLYPGEVARGQNLIGPTRDDLTLMLNGMPAREFASNGEMWTLALALKMALYGLVAEERGVRPIVILDDVFAQLDESRRGQILDFARRQRQVLITVAAAGDVPGMAADDGSVNVIDVAGLREEQDRLLHPERALERMLAAAGAADDGMDDDGVPAPSPADGRAGDAGGADDEGLPAAVPAGGAETDGTAAR